MTDAEEHAGDSNRTKIIVAVIGLIGVVAAALIASDQFSLGGPKSCIRVISVSHPNNDGSGEHFVVASVDLDELLRTTAWDNTVHRLMKEETGEIRNAIVWSGRNNQDLDPDYGHGRWDPDSDATDWTRGDRICRPET